MKKIILAVAMSAMAFATWAQDVDSLRTALNDANARLAQIDKDAQYKKTWSRNKYMHFGFGNFETAIEGESVTKSEFAFNITHGRTIMFPKRPVCGMMKFGLDLILPEFNVAKLKTDSWTEDWSDVADGEDEMDIPDLGCWLVQAGVGIGPIATITPFAAFNNAASRLKVSLYFHYKPTASAYILSQDGDMDALWAYCNMFDFGARATWKLIGFGVEGNWGNGKFKALDFGDFGDSNEAFDDVSNAKIKRKFAQTRFYISLTF